MNYVSGSSLPSLKIDTALTFHDKRLAYEERGHSTRAPGGGAILPDPSWLENGRNVKRFGNLVYKHMYRAFYDQF